MNRYAAANARRAREAATRKLFAKCPPCGKCDRCWSAGFMRENQDPELFARVQEGTAAACAYWTTWHGRGELPPR